MGGLRRGVRVARARRAARLTGTSAAGERVALRPPIASADERRGRHEETMERLAVDAPQPPAQEPLLPDDASGASVSRLPARDRPRATLFGIPIDLAEPAETLRAILAWERDGTPRRVSYVNPHVINRSRELPDLAHALRSADLVICESRAVQLAARVLELPVPHRMTGADWIWSLAALCESGGRSLYLLGAAPPVAHEAAARLERSYPRLRIVGAHHGYAELDSAQNRRVIEDINAVRPDIVLARMGTPKQELWASRYASELDVGVVWSVGGLFDHLAGRVPRSPRLDPRRLWRRSLLDTPVFLCRTLVEAPRRRARA